MFLVKDNDYLRTATGSAESYIWTNDREREMTSSRLVLTAFCLGPMELTMSCGSRARLPRYNYCSLWRTSRISRKCFRLTLLTVLLFPILLIASLFPQIDLMTDCSTRRCTPASVPCSGHTAPHTENMRRYHSKCNEHSTLLYFDPSVSEPIYLFFMSISGIGKQGQWAVPTEIAHFVVGFVGGWVVWVSQTTGVLHSPSTLVHIFRSRISSVIVDYT